MSYTHRLRVSADGLPRPQCGGSGRSVMHMAEVDCPDCLQLEADRQARTTEPDEPEAPQHSANYPVKKISIRRMAKTRATRRTPQAAARTIVTNGPRIARNRFMPGILAPLLWGILPPAGIEAGS